MGRGKIRLDLTGVTFGRLTAVKYKGIDKYKSSLWECSCSCGGSVITTITRLRTGRTKSCGCLTKERLAKLGVTHGMSKSLTYSRWSGMVERCTCHRTAGYERYGGAGITVCKRWEDFTAFLADMGECPSKEYTLDRIDNTKGYHKDNCRWATWKEQARNRTTTIYLTFKGIRKSMSEWAEITKIKHDTLYQRIKHFEWTVEEALTTPTRNKRPNSN